MMMFMPRQHRSRAHTTDTAHAAHAAEATDVAAAGVLAQRVAQGDRQALEQAYRREAGPVYRYALALCGNPAWAADATHEAFMHFAQGAAAFDEQRGSLGAYLAGAARHCLLAMWRQQKHEVPTDMTLEAGAEAGLPPPSVTASSGLAQPSEPSAEHLLLRAQNTAALWATLARLPLPMREVVILVDLQERPYAEAAQIAGLELNTLRTRLHRARIKLAEWLNTEGGLRPEDLS